LAGFCEQGNESLVSISVGIVLTSLGTIIFSGGLCSFELQKKKSLEGFEGDVTMS
jgi:uncharacterized membrane protein YgdD (TMEM256/DUF423 family)